MIIIREIDGKEMSFDLTKQELFDAFIEQEHIWDVFSIESYVDRWGDDDFFATYNMPRKQFFELVDEMAYRMRKYISEYAEDELEACENAIDDVVYEHSRKE